MSRPPDQICVHCRKQYGAFSRVTYMGAPDGGVSVHVDCTSDFFKTMDGTLEKPKLVKEEINCVQCGVVDDYVQQVSIGKPGQMRVHETWLHAECEQAYQARLAG